MTQELVKKPRASLGSSEGEDIFGTFDTGVAKRFLAIMRPYRRAFLGAVVAVLISAASVVAIPALIGRAVNAAVARDGALLDQTLIAFAGLVAIYSTAFFIEQWLSARLAQRVIFDIRRKMFDHFQDVSLSFMDKTHVGRIMARLQGDVLQEFLESSTGAVGDFAMLIGIAAVLISMDWQLGLLTLTVLPILIAVRAVWLPFSKSSFREARDASST